MGLFEDEFSINPWYYSKDSDRATFVKRKRFGGGTEPDNPYFYDWESEIGLIAIDVKSKTDEYPAQNTKGRVLPCKRYG